MNQSLIDCVARHMRSKLSSRFWGLTVKRLADRVSGDKMYEIDSKNLLADVLTIS